MRRQKQNQHNPTNNHNNAATRVDVVFALEYPQAREVYLCGDFNQWSPARGRMFLRSGQRRWEKRVTLPPGRYEYKFLVDGQWIHDTRAPEITRNVHGSLNSVRTV